MRWHSRHRAKLALLCGALLAGPLALHFAIRAAAELDPPIVNLAAQPVTSPRPDVRRIGRSYARTRGKLLEVRLAGTPEQIGYGHARLLYPEMVKNEGVLLRRFREQVSFAPARLLLLDLAQLRYRTVDRGLSPERRREIAAGALGFQPDPYADVFPTYQRFVYLNALYDISLSFEHSPLLGCTTFTLSGSATERGHTLLARAFDFEVDEVFDDEKAVFFVLERGLIPFASVAWPGLLGVISGMNAEGLALVVHGGRAGDTRVEGEPVVHALRRVLSTARDIDEAIAALATNAAMVSHIIVVADAHGRSARIERVPGQPLFAEPLQDRAAITNHFEGPAAGDAKNEAVKRNTSTLPRRRRADELLAALDRPVKVSDAVDLLRDRRGASGMDLVLGDRRAVNALIATHGVVMDTTARVLWVSESPHLLGRFVAFDLKRLLAADYNPLEDSTESPSVGADPLFTSGEYQRWRAVNRTSN